MKTVAIRFVNPLHVSGDYHFLCDIDVQVGDRVVVDTKNGLCVGEITEVGANYPKATKYVVQKVDLDSHKARLERNKKIRESLAKLEERRKKIEAIQVYAILAKEDPELAKLLEDYHSLMAE